MGAMTSYGPRRVPASIVIAVEPGASIQFLEPVEDHVNLVGIQLFARRVALIISSHSGIASGQS